MRFIILFSFFLVLYFGKTIAQDNFRIMFYNVENLFDTRDDPQKDDAQFLPDGFMRWTPWKYWEKLRNITRVITAVGGMQSPAIVGLCEVENDSVIFDLVRRSPLRTQEYEFIVTDSPDERGIDVALLYQPHQFKPIQTNEYEVIFNRKGARPTRNILHVVGEVINGDTLDLFVCHFPSRSGGQRETEPARLETANLLKRKTDSLFALRGDTRIIIMGDFNDYPTNKSLSKVLEAGSVQSSLQKGKLYNLFRHRAKDPEFGSYKYQGKWDPLDQFIVSGNLLLNESSFHVKENEAHIFKADFLLEDDEKYYGKRPFRTNLGPRYLGGFSDHLPIYMDMAVFHPPSSS